jgi:hypothetical protein
MEYFAAIGILKLIQKFPRRLGEDGFANQDTATSIFSYPFPCQIPSDQSGASIRHGTYGLDMSKLG